MEKCDHKVGVGSYEDRSNGDYYSYLEYTLLSEKKNDIYIESEFTFCPDCGQRVRDEKGKVLEQ